MMNLFLKWNFITCLILILSIFVFYFINPSLPNLEQEKCPFCYGKSLCGAFERHEINIYNENISDKINHFFSSKNVFIANWNNEMVVLKKLGHSNELHSLDMHVCEHFSKASICNYSEVVVEDNDLESTLKIKNLTELSKQKNQKQGFLCESVDIFQFLNQIKYDVNENLWTAVYINPEPIFLQIFTRADGWPVPHLLGACGRVVVESHCGTALSNYFLSGWFDRANLALQLLQAMLMFTNGHPTYRVYLTDLSADNLVVDQNQRLYFVDLENFILKEKRNEIKTEHHSKNFDESSENFSFSSDNICNFDLSDHNYYAACQIFLNPKASWPMVPGGLLHSTPAMIRAEFPEFSKLIAQCVDLPTEGNISRHNLVVELMNQLELALSDRHNYLL